MEFSVEGVEVTQQDWEPPVSVFASAVVVQTRLRQEAAVNPSAHTCSTDAMWLLTSLWQCLINTNLARLTARRGEVRLQGSYLSDFVVVHEHTKA